MPSPSYSPALLPSAGTGVHSPGAGGTGPGVRASPKGGGRVAPAAASADAARARVAAVGSPDANSALTIGKSGW